MRSCYRFLAVCIFFAFGHGAFGEDSSHETHDHDEDPLFEQAAVYALETGTNNIIILPAEGETGFEEDSSLAFMVVPASNADQDGLEEAEEAAETTWEAYLEGEVEATVLDDMGEALPSESIVYAVSLEDPLVQVLLEITDDGSYALLVEHGSEEVSVVVTSPTGVVLTAGAEEGVEEDEEEDESSPASGNQWANAIVASFIVSFCSFAGLVIVASKRVANSIDLSHASIFAAGALLTASLLHIIPEALEGLESDFDDLHEMGIAAGVAILGGIFFGVVLHAFLEGGHSHGSDSHEHEHGATVGSHNGDFTPTAVAVKSERGEQDLLPPAAINQTGMHSAVTGTGFGDGSTTRPLSPYDSAENLQTLMDARRGKSLMDVKSLQPVCWNIIIGDLVHNFADGVTIGAAFLGCSSTIGWTVTASAVLHEVPHELADFMALINGGMSVMQAFIFNFISALSAVLGVVIMLALRETLTSADVSYILLVGGGSFIFVGLSELIPEALTASSKSKKHGGIFSPLRKLLSFVIGALIIGIPLIFDEHCEDGEHGHDH